MRTGGDQAASPKAWAARAGRGNCTIAVRTSKGLIVRMQSTRKMLMTQAPKRSELARARDWVERTNATSAARMVREVEVFRG